MCCNQGTGRTAHGIYEYFLVEIHSPGKGMRTFLWPLGANTVETAVGTFKLRVMILSQVWGDMDVVDLRMEQLPGKA